MRHPGIRRRAPSGWNRAENLAETLARFRRNLSGVVLVRPWLDRKSTYVDYLAMPRKPNNSRQTRALLAVLLDRSQIWRHGYDLSKETGLRSGTLYPLLMRLSEQGLLESRWQEPERPGLPPRHVYRLTASGLALAREQDLAAIATERAEALA
jgi:PadR family transcriptional regulator, regulatory protein PadR